MSNTECLSYKLAVHFHLETARCNATSGRLTLHRESSDKVKICNIPMCVINGVL